MITHARFTHYGRLQLLRQQLNRKPSPISDDEQRQAHHAVDMLLFVQCLLFAVGDLTRTLREAGMLRHAAKQAMNRMDALTAEVSEAAYRVFTRHTDLGRPYVDRCEAAYRIIDDSVEGISEPREVSKYKSIALALVELITEYNDRLCPRFRFDTADRLRGIPTLLRHVAAETNPLAATVIRRNVTARNLQIEIQD
ncbi:hypothetical protein [uncultured Rikenella sp.]|uniref:hypothetical protein n=1 Tax=uncultured Rikenella sp. TaxID=368003 RepID=UPI00262116CC|nr:hypothetical protein [uncultured Rikenella sp.]